MGKNNGFYKDLDKSKDKKGSCSCITLAVAFFVVLCIVELFLFLTAKNFRYNPRQGESFSLPTSFESNISPVDLGNGTVRLAISQGQFCKMIVESGVNHSGLECAISKESVKVSGKISSFLPSNTSISIIPRAKNDKIELELKSVEVGTVDISPSLFKVFTGKIENLINSNEAIKSIKVKSCQLEEGMVVIEGTK